MQAKVGALFVVAWLGMGWSIANGQTPQSSPDFQPCPSARVEGPKTVNGKKPVVYTVKTQESGSAPASASASKKVDWAVRGGTIVEGQGTNKIKVMPAARTVTANATVRPKQQNCALMELSMSTVIAYTFNSPPTVSAVGSETEISLACSADGTNCEPTSNPVVAVNTFASDPDGDQLVYSWSTNMGRIVGEGAEQVWDLSGASPGSYNATVEVTDPSGVNATATVTVNVSVCHACAAPDPTAITGDVKNSGGTSVPFARLVATRVSDGRKSYGVTGPNGHYTIRYLPTGTYQVQAANACCESKTQDTNLKNPSDQVVLDFSLALKPQKKP